jgi:hypothetical protein
MAAGAQFGTQFACFTGTKVQILTREGAERCEREAMQRALEHAQRAGVGHTQHIQMLLRELEVLGLKALLVQKYKY